MKNDDINLFIITGIMESSGIEKRKRIDWIDSLKGFLIILVVIGHMCAHLERTSGLYTFIYTFHMPLFFMVSGFLIVDLENKDFKKYITRKMTVLLLPFLSFAVISSYFRGWEHFPAFFLSVNKHGYWFLLALFLFCFFLTSGLKLFSKIPSPNLKWFVSNAKILKLVGTFFIVESVFILVLFVSSPIIKDIFFPKTILLYWPYFVFGYLLSNYKIYIPDHIRGICGLVFICIWWGSLKYNLSNETLFQLSRFCACIFFFYCFMNFSSGRVVKSFRIFGKESLGIYVMHYWFYPGIGAFLLAHLGEYLLFETCGFVIVAIMISITCIVIKRFLCTNRFLALILFGQKTDKRVV